MATTGTATLDFGSTGTDVASVAVTGQTGILSGSLAEAWLSRGTTADNDTEAHQMAAALMSITTGDIVAGTGFTIKAFCHDSELTGTFSVNWVWA